MYSKIYGVLKEIYGKVENKGGGKEARPRRRIRSLWKEGGGRRKLQELVQRRLIGVTRYMKDVWFESKFHISLFFLFRGSSGYLGFEGVMYCRSHFGQLFKKTATLRKALKEIEEKGWVKTREFN
ncbi:unnamed protein product [Lactuca virosa]|uniref:Uncharacterized protein n=1 Tax=Lactuca virosa TaxID=75947 RepID=A0AAU9PBP8_9ASTR|nr:unnamed protein product [Lactuca virosa]